MRKERPQNLPAYRLLTGPDDATFCQRVSEALALGYELYGSPSITYHSEKKRLLRHRPSSGITNKIYNSVCRVCCITLVAGGLPSQCII